MLDDSSKLRAHVIVIGNEKGGAGKTTSTMHIIASLLNLGFSVASIDLDSRQLSLSHYLENRKRTNEKLGVSLPLPSHYIIAKSTLPHVQEAEEEEKLHFTELLQSLLTTQDFVVIDTPGSNSFLSQLAHSYADTLITPINDSFVDLDVLAKVEPDTYKIIGPGIYSDMVWRQKMVKAGREKQSINWIVMRNRLSTIDAKNKRLMAEILEKLAQRVGFRHAPGFSERVIFRELFLQGMTLLDVVDTKGPVTLNLSHVAARQELRDFLKFLHIPKIDEALRHKEHVTEAALEDAV